MPVSEEHAHELAAFHELSLAVEAAKAARPREARLRVDAVRACVNRLLNGGHNED